jgi:hypothetical protein
MMNINLYNNNQFRSILRFQRIRFVILFNSTISLKLQTKNKNILKLYCD